MRDVEGARRVAHANDFRAVFSQWRTRSEAVVIYQVIVWGLRSIVGQPDDQQGAEVGFTGEITVVHAIAKSEQRYPFGILAGSGRIVICNHAIADSAICGQDG